MTIAGHDTLLHQLPCSSRSGHKLDAGRTLAILRGSQASLTWPILSFPHLHISCPKCLDLLSDSSLPSLRPQLSHCFSLGGVMNPSAQQSLQAAPSHCAHLFLKICSNTDLSEIANTERQLFFLFSFNVSTHLPHPPFM